MCTPVSLYVDRGLLPLDVEEVEGRRASGTSGRSDESRRPVVTLKSPLTCKLVPQSIGR